MYVVATAGHVDHGKSTLVRALTGMEPDRWAEERRRGMTIDLGYAWMTLPPVVPGGPGAPGSGGVAEKLAFVDVPGHERFVPNMLAGLGPVPAVMFVVAADGGWMPQSAEHLAAVDALGVRHGLLVITRSDLADPEPATRQALAEIARTSLGTIEAIQVSAVTGQGLDDLRAALARLAASLGDHQNPARSAPAERAGSAGLADAARSGISGAGAPDMPDISTYGGAESPVRLWIDRSFTIRGAGTVVTGTLPAGTVRNGQELLLVPADRSVRVRGLEALGEPADVVTGVARVALNLRGIPADLPGRGMALIDPGRWTLTSEIDVRITPTSAAPNPKFPPDLLVHIGSARTRARLRVLGADPTVGPGSAVPGAPGPGSSGPGSSGPGSSGPGSVRPGSVCQGSARSRAAGAGADVRGSVGQGSADPGSAGSAADAGADGTADEEGTSRAPAAIYARLRLRDPLPLHAGDRVILRDPGAAGLAIYGARVLDPFPPPLARRGAGAAAVRELTTWPDIPRAADLLSRHKLLRARQLAAAGVTDRPAPVAGDWLADPAHWAWLRAELPKVVAAFSAKDPLAPGMPAEAARAALGLPSRDLVPALAGEDVVLDGAYLRIIAKTDSEQGDTPVSAGKGATGTGVLDAGVTDAAPVASGAKPAAKLPPRIAEGVQVVLDGLAGAPFAAPDTERLRALGLDARALAAAARVGLLLRIADLVVLAPGADRAAARVLAGLDQPFTTSQARQALHTSRRVAIPLLEHLDRTRVTERLPGDLRRLRTVFPPGE